MTGNTAFLPAILLIASVSAASTFDDPESHEVAGSPFGVTVGDIDGDGLADAAVSAQGVSLLLSNGTGLGPEQRIGTGVGNARYVAIEDIDGDGDRDLVVLLHAGDNLIAVFRNQGGGSFTGPEFFGAPAVAFALRIADIDSDGDPDAVVVSGLLEESVVTLLRNDGSGSFGDSESHHLADVQIVYVADLDVADFNGDGHLDVAGGTDNSFSVEVLLNDGAGGLLPATTVDLGPITPLAVRTRDVNHDSRPDLLVVSCNELRVGLNDGAGGFVLADVVVLNGSCHSITNPTGIAAGHFDDDAVIDLVYPSRSTDTLRVLQGAGDGTFEESAVLATDPDPITVAVGDVNGDGSDDVVGGSIDGFARNTIVLLTQAAADTDGDGVDNSVDNCTEVANPGQRDTDADDIGNDCDPDVNAPNDCAVNFLDLNVYKANFFAAGDLDTDNNGDGQTNFVDLNIVKSYFFGAPGPSANGCD